MYGHFLSYQNYQRLLYFITGNKPKQRLNLREFKAAKVIGMVIGCFIFCVTPIVFVDIIDMCTNGEVEIPSSFVKVAIVLAYLNPMMNFFIYAGMSKEYRRGYKSLFSDSSIQEVQ